MSKLILEYPTGATPLDPDEINGLIPSYVSSQGELNAAEQANILKAVIWVEKVKKKKETLSEIFVRELHTRMFKDVWRWAGKYRLSDKSIGIDWKQIPESIVRLCNDAKFWIENKTYNWDELGCRFHHRLVQIHPFANGNGRHARLMTDILLSLHGVEKFSWGSKEHRESIDQPTVLRKTYIEALQEADRRNFSRLIEFVRS